MTKNPFTRIGALSVLLLSLLIPGISTMTATTASASSSTETVGSISIPASREAALRAGIIKTAASQNGVKYLFATAEPGVSFDCSGLVAWVYYMHDIPMYRSAADMRSTVKYISASQAKPGDLIFSGRAANGAPTHVGIIADPKAKTYWNATAPGDQVRLSSYAGSWYNGSTFGSAIVTTGSTSTPPTTTPKPTNPEVTTVKRFVKSGVTLNVRASANTSSKIVGKLKARTAITGTISGGWMKITSGPYAGKYVSASYLRA